MIETLKSDFFVVKRGFEQAPVGEAKKEFILSSARLSGVVVGSLCGYWSVSLIMNGGSAASLAVNLFMTIIGHDSYTFANNFTQIRKNFNTVAVEQAARAIYNKFSNVFNTIVSDKDKKSLEEIGSSTIATELSSGTVFQKFYVYGHFLWTKQAVNFFISK